MAITISGNGITSANIADGTITTDDINASDVTSLKSGRKNLIINGGMKVWQRGTSSSASVNGCNSVDRMRLGITDCGSWTLSQDTDAPDGFSKSLKYQCTTAKASLASTSELMVQYRVEGQDAQQLAYGTSSAKEMTLSFWVKTNKTGTYTAWFYTADGGRHYAQNFTVNSADTWEKKTISIAGDTAGTINDDTGEGFRVQLYFAAGTSYTSGTLATAWEALSNPDRCAGQTVNLADSTANYLKVTGMQLELGSVATDFEHRSYGEELALCQRYYLKDTNTGYHTAIGQNTDRALGIAWMLPVPFRASPTITVSGTSYALTHTTYNSTSSPTVHQSAYTVNESSIRVGFTGFSGITDNRLCAVQLNTVTFDAEL